MEQWSYFNDLKATYALLISDPHMLTMPVCSKCTYFYLA